MKSNDRCNGLLLQQKFKHLKQFKEFHAHLLKSLLPHENPLPIGRLVSVAALSSDPTIFDYARLIFRNLAHHNTFMYNNMIRGYLQMHAPISAISCYLDMLRYGLPANNYTFPPLIKACTLLFLSSSLSIGRLVHAHVVKFGFSDDGFTQSALIEFYSSVLDLGCAKKLFDGSLRRDVVLWTAMIDGYAKSGDVKKARELFEEMPERNTISWSVMIAGYSRVSNFEEALCLFQQMQEVGRRPNESILVSILTSCAHLGALTQGLWVHSYVKLHRLDSNPILGTALVDMYAKCGCIESAMSVFEDISEKDVGAWNAIISGVAMNGNAKKSLKLFNKMNMNGSQPNEVTFIAVLSACAHAGLIEEGRELFDQMKTVYGVEPRLEHHACMVDLFARAGRIEEAEKFVEEKMGGFAGGDANVWGALFSACRIYGNVEVGNRVWEKLAKLRSADCGTYVLLYNMYREAGWEMEANRVRGLITEEGLKKKPGCSLIEVDGAVDEFIAGDFSHPQAREILEVVDSLVNIMKSEGLCL
ncbi:pentatricopeptide repeat-containing protein At5g06540-like [Magnolia sinica]|uniref:pentatricopeptide repeat-containing protein At5g06540-like n=1 Tax=Magnolia sinica TaxID=86752 RepID=UPI00265A5FA9|nr:pentatricopeptide repeat-containing protein At5g06540-like [Magnolia sinica]